VPGYTTRPPRAKTPRPRARTSAPDILQITTDPVARQDDMLHDALPAVDIADGAGLPRPGSPAEWQGGVIEEVVDPRAGTVAAPVPQPVQVTGAGLPPMVPLRVAVWESHGHLASARDAVTAAGHVVAGSGAGTEGVKAIQAVLREGELDALIVALPPVAPGASMLGGAPGDAAGALIDAALALEPRRPVIIAAVAGGLALGARRAAAAGADLVIARPHDVDKLAPVLLAAQRLGAQRKDLAAARGSEAALRARLEQVAHTSAGGLEPFELFQRALELEIKRARRYAYPLAVALFAVDIAPPPPPTGIRGILRARIGTALLRAIRDIDLATQLDHERFLVLLPYTDLSGAATVGKRVLEAVAAGDAVTAGGRTFPLAVVGAVAGASPGQPLSFSRLMRDATRALEQARRDGAQLAVQP
jgi:hypothetical protein